MKALQDGLDAEGPQLAVGQSRRKLLQARPETSMLLDVMGFSWIPPAGTAPVGGPLWQALLLTLAFAGLARWLRAVSFSGALAGAAICFVLFATGGPAAFWALVTVFVLTWIATRAGYSLKQERGTAERRGGRTASQVLANLGVAGGASLLFAGSHGNELFLAAAAAALAEAAADTVSSECGQTMSDQAWLITTGERVPAGTDGGISVAGSVAGVLAAMLVAWICHLVGLLPVGAVGIVAVSAVVGMVADSFLGAWLERRGWLNNNAVNGLSTLVAAMVAGILLKIRV